MSATLAAAGAIIATGGAAHADDQVVPVTCSMQTAMAGTVTRATTLTVGVGAPDAVVPGSTFTVSVSAHPEVLPATDDNPQNLVAYEDVQTTYAVVGGTVVPGSEQTTSGATIKSFPIASHYADASNSVTEIVDGPMPAGTFVPPAFTFQVHAVSDSAVSFVATEHDETVDFDGPGPAESDPATCPIGVTLATTTIDPNATTTSTSTSSSSTSTSSSSSTTTSFTTTTVGGPPPDPWTISDASVIEPTRNHGVRMIFVISRTDASAPGRIKFVTVDGTAQHKVDFTARSNTVKLRSRQFSTRIEIPIHYNPHFHNPESFTVMLIDPASGQLVDIGTGTITSS